MNSVYTFLILCLIQLSILYTNGDDLTKDTVCQKGALIQLENEYMCVCPSEHVYSTATDCIEVKDLKKCTDAGEVDKACGNNAFCKEIKKDGQPQVPPKYGCQCPDKYEEVGKGPIKHCIPTVCKNKDCGNGTCVLGAADKAVCACFLGFELENDTCKKTKVEKVCDVKCDGPAECKKHALGVHYCSTTEAIITTALKDANDVQILKKANKKAKKLPFGPGVIVPLSMLEKPASTTTTTTAPVVGSTGNSFRSSLSQFFIYLTLVAVVVSLI